MHLLVEFGGPPTDFLTPGFYQELILKKKCITIKCPFRKGVGRGVWIGLYSERKNEPFKWHVDNQPTTYVKWRDGQPNRSGISNNEYNCVRLYGGSFDFDDSSCNTGEFLYLCKQGKNQPMYATKNIVGLLSI